MLLQILAFITSIIILIIVVNSCNFYTLVDNHLTKKFERQGMQSKTLKIDDKTSLHYWQGGEGKPLLLLHGFGATAKYQWEKQVKLFAKKYQLIIPNLIYFGESNSKKEEYSIDFQVECIQKLIETLQLDSFSVIGLSYGGVVGISLANKIPTQVQKLVICDSPIRYYTKEDVATTLEKYNIESPEELLVPAKKEGLIPLMKIAYHKPPFTPKFVLKDVHQGLFGSQTENKKKLLSYMDEHRVELSEKEYNLSSKILLIWGTEDALIPTRIGKELQGYFGDEQATFVTIEKTAHMPNIERPKIYNTIVLDFLTQ